MNTITITSKSPTILLDIIGVLTDNPVLKFQLLKITYQKGPPLLFTAELTTEQSMTAEEVATITQRVEEQANKLGGIASAAARVTE